MTLEQAIQHCKDKAKELRQEAILFNNNPMYSDNTVADCLECANEHEQLAEWLTELKERREAVKKLEDTADYYRDSLFGDGIRFALKVIKENGK